MTLSEFAKLVQAMRDAQEARENLSAVADFFLSVEALQLKYKNILKCKELEEKVDSELLLIKGRQGTQAPISFTGFDDYEG